MPHVLLLAAMVAAAPLSDRYLSINEVKPGMKGIGKTVLKGTTIVDFDVEVIGVLRNIAPKQDLILVRCAGHDLETTGIIMGMSGSPIYLEGKLVGALAYAWRFGKVPIAGVTPIEEMLTIGTGVGEGAPPLPAPEAAQEGRPGDETPGPEALGREAAARRLRIPTASEHRLIQPLEVEGRTYGRVRILSQAPSRPPAGEPMPTLSPIATPVMIRGAGAETVKALNPLLEAASCVPVMAGGLSADAVAGLEATLEPGAVCAVSLVTGDADYTAIGTVTDRVGEVIWAFGHPFYGQGDIEMPLQTGAIVAVMPSQMASFKFGVPLKPAGRIVADETTGLRGIVGEPARMVPVTAEVHRRPSAPAAYRFNLMRHPEFTPGLLRAVLADAIFARGGLPTLSTVSYRASLDFAGYKPIELANVHAGTVGAMEALRRVYLTAGELLNNDIQPAELRGASLSVTIDQGLRSASIESVRLDTPRVRPGEEVVVRVVLLPYRAEREIATVRLTIPAGTPEGTYSLTICDAERAGRIDLQARPHRVEPRTLEDLVDLLREQRPSRHLYLRLTLPDGGVAVEGRELPRLPDFARQLFSGTRWTGAVTPVRRVIGADTSTAWVVDGQETVQVQVTMEP